MLETGKITSMACERVNPKAVEFCKRIVSANFDWNIPDLDGLAIEMRSV
jgi:hypothetical protein